MQVLAIIPARANSKGIAQKNFRALAGRSPLQRAIDCVRALDDCRILVTSDAPPSVLIASTVGLYWSLLDLWLDRPAALARDDTPMRAVVADVLARVPGPDNEILLLVQPTQPLRQPTHLLAAIRLMAHGARCVVSVTETESPQKLLRLDGDMRLIPWDEDDAVERRQTATPAYRRDGTVYAFRRSDEYIAWPATPLYVPAAETCALDTPEDWAEAERRLTAAAPRPGAAAR